MTGHDMFGYLISWRALVYLSIAMPCICITLDRQKLWFDQTRWNLKLFIGLPAWCYD